MINIETIDKIAKQIALNKKNTLLIGPAGTGKTQITRNVIKYMDPLNRQEESDRFKIEKVAGLMPKPGFGERPFRAPHHTVSEIGMIGKRPDHLCIPTFGELTLAHHGILFLDEIPEFNRFVLEAVAFAARNGYIIHGSKSGNHGYPAKFLLIGAMNPCPCGYRVGGTVRCLCTSDSVKRYKNRIKPLKDVFEEKIDLRTLTALTT